MQLLFKGEVYKIIGAAMEVHRILGCGFLEAVYQEALSIELQERNLPFSEQEKLQIIYKHKILKKEYTPDFICYDKIILELKALAALTPDHEAQLLNYLKATGYKLGLLINFGTASLQYKRMIL